jgi:DNA repair protein RecO (recombination protein O)
MPSFNTKAIVLKNYQHQDTDKIYTLLSKEKGRISVIGKGVRKVTSRRAGNMDTLNHIEVQLSKHKSGILYLGEVKSLATFKKIKSRDNLANKAFYLLELINKTTFEDENAQKIYYLLVKTLEKLESDEEEAALLINKFEIKLSQLLGYQPPQKILQKWRLLAKAGDYEKADKVLKDYLAETLQERMKSLELE